MTTIQPTNLMPSLFGTSNASDSTQAGGDSFEALLLSVSSTDSDSSTSATNTANSSGGMSNIDQLLQYVQQVIFDTENSLGSLGATNASSTQAANNNIVNPFATSSTDAFNADGTITAAGLFDSGGPLPAFLAKVDTDYHLNATQQQALRDITYQFKDAQDTPSTVQQIGDALAKAGIGV